MKWIALPLFFIMTGMLGCTMLSMEDVPSEELIKKWDTIQPFIIEPSKIMGIYRNIDIDAIVFKYSTIADRDKFWAHLKSNLQGTKWLLIAETSETRTYERRFSKGDQSPARPDMALFSSAELLKIEYLPGKQMVIVGYVQADSSEKDTSFAFTNEAKWAEKEIWPRFNKAKSE